MHTDEQSNITKIVEQMKQNAKGSQDPACECATCILYRRCRSNKANAYGGQNHIIDVMCYYERSIFSRLSESLRILIAAFRKSSSLKGKDCFDDITEITK